MLHHVGDDPTMISVAGDDRLIALCHPYELDGRVSTHPVAERGWASMNCFALREGDDLMLIDGGLTIHGDALLTQVAQLVDDATVLSIVPLRFGEFSGISNIAAIAARFPRSASTASSSAAPTSGWPSGLPVRAPRDSVPSSRRRSPAPA